MLAVFLNSTGGSRSIYLPSGGGPFISSPPMKACGGKLKMILYAWEYAWGVCGSVIWPILVLKCA